MKQKKLFKVITIFFIIMFLIGVVCITVYPFDNRNLSIHFITDEQEYIFNRNNEEIAAGSCREYFFEDMNEIAVKKIRIYGQSKTTVLKEISFGGIPGYIENIVDGQLLWNEDSITLTGVDDVHLIMNTDFEEILQKQSETVFQERLMYISLLGCLLFFAILIISVIKERLTADKHSTHGPVYETRKFFGDIKRYRQYMVYAAETDLKAEVADSYLNRLWWLLEPLFNMLVYVIVFGNIMGTSVENYATFVFSAFLMWNFFSKTINYSVKLVRSNKDIITKVYIPKFILLLSNMILNLFKLAFSMIVLVIMMVIFQIEIGLNTLWVFPAFGVIALLAFGVGMIFLHFGVFIDDLSYAVGILLNMLMFLSGIFYEVMTTLPEPLNNIMMCLNPVAILTDTMRNALLYNQASNLPALGVWALISIIICCVGVHIVYENENSYVKVV